MRAQVIVFNLGNLVILFKFRTVQADWLLLLPGFE